MQITHSLAVGGLEQVLVSLAKSLDSKNFEVCILCLRELGSLSREIEKLGVKVILLPQKKKGTDYLSFFKVANIIRQEQPQILHTHNTQPLVDGTLGALLSGLKPEIIHTDHAREWPDKKRYMFAEWLMSHFVFKMVGVSEKTTENLRVFEKIPRRKLLTIENGIDQSRFVGTVDKKVKRKELNVSERDTVIGVVSRIEKIKGISYLLQAMPAILKDHPTLKLLIVGDGAEKNSLQQESCKLGIHSNVIFTGMRNDVPEILQVLDIFILPSLSEGLPVGLLEAMAAGCPIVATNVGGIPQVLQHGETALLTPEKHPAALSNAILQLLKDDDFRKNLSLKAKAIFSQKYGAVNMACKYMELYEKALVQYAGRKK